MSKTLWNALRLSPALLGATIIVANATLAAEDSARSISQDKTTAATELPASGLSQDRQNAKAADASEQAAAALQSFQVSPISSNSTELAQVPAAGNGSSSNTQQDPPSTLEQIDRYNRYNQPTKGAEQGSSNSTLEQINQYNQQSSGLEQVTSVSQLRDVQPTDWAFQALQSLVERYGCIEGYPDRTYRGNRALTRYEFAAGLNSCLNRIQELIGSIRPDVSAEDLERLRRLQEEFRAELTTLRGRVDGLEARTARLEAQQFSTTTKLRGEAIFALASVFGDEKAVRGGQVAGSSGDVEDNPIFADRVRLNLDTSFTGKDRLRTRLQARNITQFDAGAGTAATSAAAASANFRPNITGTSMSRLSFDGDEGNDITLHRLEYRFPVGSRTNVYLEATGGEFNDNMYTFNPLFESSAQGSVSRFGRFNPIYRQSGEGAGLTLEHNFSKGLGLSLGYLVPRTTANDPSDFAGGLFNGSYAALAQLAIRPSNFFNLGLTYVHSYNNNASGVSVSGNTGSLFANRPFGNVATSADHFGVQASFRLSRYFTLSGWGGYTEARQESGGDADATIFNYAVTLGLSDFGRKGNVLGFVAGQPPKVTDNDVETNEDPDTSYHLEAFYRIRVSDNISITPGAFVILNPEHNDDNDTIYVGTLRTTFTF